MLDYPSRSSVVTRVLVRRRWKQRSHKSQRRRWDNRSRGRNEAIAGRIHKPRKAAAL